jgi:23S rRNA maturation-related 3'-5' exoribonuclease YhaM
MKKYIEQISNNDLKNKLSFLLHVLEEKININPATSWHHNYIGGWKIYTYNTLDLAIWLFDVRKNDIFQGVRRNDVILLSIIHNLGALYKYKYDEILKKFIINNEYSQTSHEMITLNVLSECGLLLDSIQLNGLCSLFNNKINSRLGLLIHIASLMSIELNKKTAPQKND